MDTKIIKAYHEKLSPLVITDFEKGLLEACLQNLLDVKNKLRFNNFAYSLRELSRHILLRFSPDIEVKNCSWYKDEGEEPGQITRGQRIQYAIQGGLSDKYIKTELFDINVYRRPILAAIRLLSKYTHVNEDTFNISDSEVEKLSNGAVKALADFIKSIDVCREHLISKLEGKIDNAFIEHIMSEVIDDIDILSTHHNIEYVHPTSVDVKSINSRSINLDVGGSIKVRQQWGSDSDLSKGDGLEMNSSFPFESVLTIEIDSTFPKGNLNVETFNVNTDDW